MGDDEALIEQVNESVTDIIFKCGATASKSIYYMSDLHLDSPSCDRGTLTKHLKDAETIGAPVSIAGDIFDAMQSHNDPRRRHEELKAKYKCSNYLDAIVEDAIAFLGSFKVDYLIGLGNHETVILTKLNTNLNDRLTKGLQREGRLAVAMGYAGYIRVRFSYKNGQSRAMKVTYFHHGTGGNAPVTRGMIQTNRQAVFLGDADLVHNGHNHQEYSTAIPRERLANNGKVFNDVVWFIRTPGYKTGGLAAGEAFGYGLERHPAPTPVGCVRADYEYNKHTGIEVTPVPRIRQH